MRKHKALGVNALPEIIEAIDKRRGELDLSRAKYLTTLAKLDIEHKILVAETSEKGQAIVNLVEPKKPIVRIDKAEMDDWGDKIAEKAVTTLMKKLAVQIPGLQGLNVTSQKRTVRTTK